VRVSDQYPIAPHTASIHLRNVRGWSNLSAHCLSRLVTRPFLPWQSVERLPRVKLGSSRISAAVCMNT
jgi:hypothetical protein